MLDYTQSFEEFASSLGPTDLALYGGAAIILWILFKNKLSPVQTFVRDIVSKVSEIVSKKSTTQPTVKTSNKDVFFQLVSSWKQTRDLAVLNGCSEAVKVADQMFPFLSPNVCKDKEEIV